MKRFIFLTMAIMLLVMSFIPVSYAAEYNYPSIEELKSSFSWDHYIMSYNATTDQYILDFVRDENKYQDQGYKFEVFTNTSNGPYLLLYKDGQYNRQGFYNRHYVAVKNSNGEYNWIEMSKSTVSDLSLGIIGTNVYVSSTLDIKDKDGNLVFPPAPTELYQIVHQMTETEMTKFPTVLVGAMKTLALCGVGCLALLMALPLFGKVLKRYLPQ